MNEKMVKDNDQATQRSHSKQVKEFNTSDEDMAIEQWKDSRLKKLEDFTKDLGRSSSAKRLRRNSNGSQMTTIKHSNEVINTTNTNDYITLSSNQIGLSHTNTTNQTQVPMVLNATTSMGENQSQQINTHQGIKNEAEENIDNENNDIYAQLDVIDQPYYDGEEMIDDDLLLTKTEGSQMLKFGSNACSTQRSQFPQSNQSVNGEFEKRITDIKQKLTMIKNTINNEIENSQIMNQTDNNISDYNSNGKQYGNFGVSSPQIMSGQTSQRRKQIINQSNQYSAYSNNKINNGNALKQNSVLSSLDQFQNKLNHIKENINKTYQVETLENTNRTMQLEDERERFNRIKCLIDNSFHANNQGSSQIQTSYKGDTKDFSQQRLQSIPISLEQTVSLSNHNEKLISPTANQQQQHSSQSAVSSLHQENESLKQKLQVMTQQEQLLNKKMDQLYTEQQKEKERYEEQLRKIQDEIGKMCEIMQEMNKKKKKNESKSRCSKRLRIANLEKMVKDLQQQLVNQTTLQMQVQMQQHQQLESSSGGLMLNNTQVSNQSMNTLSMKNFNQKVKELNDSNSQLNANQKSKSQKAIDMPKKPNNSDKQNLEEKVSFLEQKMKKFHQDLQETNQTQSLRDQLTLAMQENNQLRENYTQQYQNLLTAFENFKQDMELKFHQQEEDFFKHQEEVKQEWFNEVKKRDKTIKQLRKENQYLREKIGKIKDVFDLKRSPRYLDENFNQQNYDDEEETQFDGTLNLQLHDVVLDFANKKQLTVTHQPHKEHNNKQKTMNKQQSKTRLNKTNKNMKKRAVKDTDQKQMVGVQQVKIRRGSSAKIVQQRL